MYFLVYEKEEDVRLERFDDRDEAESRFEELRDSANIVEMIEGEIVEEEINL